MNIGQTTLIKVAWMDFDDEIIQHLCRCKTLLARLADRSNPEYFNYNILIIKDIYTSAKNNHNQLNQYVMKEIQQPGRRHNFL